MKKLLSRSVGVLLFFAAFSSPNGFTADVPVYNISVKDGYFSPVTVEVPKNVKFKLLVKNDGKGPEEFESNSLNRETVVGPGKTLTMYLGPLNAGEYTFFGDFHRDTANGKIVAK